MRDFIKLVVDNTQPAVVSEEQTEVKEDWLDREEPSILPDLKARAQARRAQDVLDRAEQKMSDDLIPTTSRPQLRQMYQQMVQQQHQGARRKLPEAVERDKTPTSFEIDVGKLSGAHTYVSKYLDRIGEKYGHIVNVQHGKGLGWSKYVVSGPTWAVEIVKDTMFKYIERLK